MLPSQGDDSGSSSSSSLNGVSGVPHLPSDLDTTTLSHTSTSHIPTEDGVINVRPYRSNSNAQLKAVLTFEPRMSSLDRENTQSQTDEFRGFFTLFWIGLGLLFAKTSFQSWEDNHTPLSWTFGRLITRDAVVLAVSDGVMMAAMLLCVPFVKALQNRWFPYYWTGAIIQHIFQTTYLFVAIWWGYHRQWYWVQAGFLVLHALSNLMKVRAVSAQHPLAKADDTWADYRSRCTRTWPTMGCLRQCSSD